MALQTNATQVEVMVVGQCPAILLEPPANVFRRVVVREGETTEALGDLPSGAYGLYSRAIDDRCHVIAAGCTPVLVAGGESGELAVTLSSVDGEECVASLCPDVCGTSDAGEADASSDGGLDAGDASDASDAIDASDALVASDALDASDASEPCPLGNYPATINVDSPAFYFRFEEGSAAEDDRGGTEAELTGDFDVQATSAFPSLGNSLSLGESGAFELLTNLPDDPTFTLAVWIRVSADIVDQLPRAIFIGEDFRVSGFRFWIVEGPAVEYTTSFGRPMGMRIDPVVFGELPLNEWTHVAVSVGGDEVRGYMNGAEVVRSEVSNLIPGSSVAGSGFLNGLSGGIDIDELVYYPRVLDAEVVQRHYQAALGCNAP